MEKILCFFYLSLLWLISTESCLFQGKNVGDTRNFHHNNENLNILGSQTSNSPTASPTLNYLKKKQTTQAPTDTSEPTFEPTFEPTPSAEPTPESTAQPIFIYQPSYPAFCRKTSGAPPNNNAQIITLAYYRILADFNALALNYSSIGPLQLSNLLGKAVRLTFHDAGEADISTPGDLNGPDGCLSGDRESAGLLEPNSMIFTVFETVWQKYCDKISRADFWVLWAKLAIEHTQPKISIPYHFGRVDSKDCSSGKGRLPGGNFGYTQLETVFEKRMGLTMNDTVTLLGAHTVGHVHIANSGFGQNPRTNIPGFQLNAWDLTPHIFDNFYYQSINNFNWLSTLPVFPDKTVFQRNGSPTILLNVDVSMDFNVSVPFVLGQDCGISSSPTNGPGCFQPFGGNRPSTAALVVKYGLNPTSFYKSFAVSFTKMTTVGYSIGTPTAKGRLGNLTPIVFPSTQSPTREATATPSAVSPNVLSSPSFTPTTVSPSLLPSTSPSSSSPSSVPPTVRSTGTPSSILPTVKSTGSPSSTSPTVKSTGTPSSFLPTVKSSGLPSSILPTVRSSGTPSTALPTVKGSGTPSTFLPTGGKSSGPSSLFPTTSLSPSSALVIKPTPSPSNCPSVSRSPSVNPSSISPSLLSTSAPHSNSNPLVPRPSYSSTLSPTLTGKPTTPVPTIVHSAQPTVLSSVQRTNPVSSTPSIAASPSPSVKSSVSPTAKFSPTNSPTRKPSLRPSS